MSDKFTVGSSSTVELNGSIIAYCNKDNAEMICKMLNGYNDHKYAIDKLQLIKDVVSADDQIIDNQHFSVQTVSINDKPTDTYQTETVEEDKGNGRKIKTVSIDLLKKECPQCGKKFTTYKQNKRFCCEKCKRRYHYEEERQKDKTNQTTGYQLKPGVSITATNKKDEPTPIMKSLRKELDKISKEESLSNNINVPEGLKPPKKWCGGDLDE